MANDHRPSISPTMLKERIGRRNGTTFRFLSMIMMLEGHLPLRPMFRSSDGKVPDGLSRFECNIIVGLGPKDVIGIIRFIKGSDVVYSCNGWLESLAMIPLARIVGTSYVFEAHTIISQELEIGKRNRLVVHGFKVIERLVTSNADGVVALSNGIGDYYSRFNGKVIIIPAIMDPSPSSDRIATDRRTVALIGPFSGWRNQRDLEFVHEHIEGFDPRIDFLIIGNCDVRLDHPRVHYTGFLESDLEFRERLRDADAVLVPSIVPTLGPLSKIIVSMSLGIPVISTPEGLRGLDWPEPSKDIIVSSLEGLVGTVNEAVFSQGLKEIGRKASYGLASHNGVEANRIRFIKFIGDIVGK